MDFINLHRNGNAYVHCNKPEVRNSILKILRDSQFENCKTVDKWFVYIKFGAIDRSISPDQFVSLLSISNPEHSSKPEHLTYFTGIPVSRLKTSLVFELDHQTGTRMLYAKHV